ncbi:MAG: hypothetical protein GX638_01805 [Crenarchaeota archaeon]|nr:hypothetical protein [Thermoproteota archaeon]
MNIISKLLKNRLALSTVVTTLIILVISVLLASVVTYFAINVVSTRVQEESLHMTKQHIWHNATSTAGTVSASLASLMVINTGGRDVVIDKLAVRGQEAAWNDTATETKRLVLYCVTNEPIQDDLSYIPNFNTTGTNSVTIGASQYDFNVANNDLVLRSGFTLVVYIVNPDSITINDIGLTVSITLYTAQAMYYREGNVQAVS